MPIHRPAHLAELDAFTSAAEKFLALLAKDRYEDAGDKGNRATLSGPVPDLEITESRKSQAGDIGVRRAFPLRGLYTVGPWCLVHHAGPAPAGGPRRIGTSPHRHIALQTVTWPVESEAPHRDSRAR